MKPFYVRFGAYVMAEDQIDALRRSDWLRASCITRDMIPGRSEVGDVSENDIERNPALRRLVDRFTRPKHGQPASKEERRDVLRAVAIAYQGDAGMAQAIVREIELALGYLPRDVAVKLIAHHAKPVARAVA